MKNFLRKMQLHGLAKRLAGKTTGIALGALLLSSGAAYAQLSGTYTICSSGCDYSTVQDAANDLMNNGISASVTMEIKTGSYYEAVYLGYVSGTSSSKTITFKGMGTKNTDVRIWDDYNYAAWYFDGVSYVTLENLHVETKYYTNYVYAIDIQSSSDITVKNCRVTASTSGSYIYSHHPLNIQYSTDIKILNNHIRGGGYMGIGDGFSGYNTRVTIEGNRVTKFYYYGAMFYYNTDMVLRNNSFDSCSIGTGQVGIYTYGGYGNNLIKGNTGSNLYYLIYDYAYGTDLIDSNYTGSNIYYGLQTYPISTASVVDVTRNRIRSQYVGMYLYGYGITRVYNNMIDLGSSASYGFYISPYNSGTNMDIYHNTLYYTAGNYPIYVYNYYTATGLKIRNNIITMGSGTFYFTTTPVSGQVVDGNTMYRTNGSFAANFAGTSYTTHADYVKALANIGTGQNEMSTPVTFANAPTDIHLDHTNPAPFSTGLGLGKDYDGDTRCAIFPTVGADETKNTSGDNFKNISGTKFTGPGKSYIGYPTVFFNSASASTKLMYKWYVDGVYVSDSFHLKTALLKYPQSTVKLEAYNCSDVDSFKMTLTVDTPASAPTSDFISDVNVIRQGEVVQFTDLSTGYPSSWKWSINPASGPNGATFTYVSGSDQSQINKVRFTEPGLYRICLTASNARGKGSVECKADYVEVTPSFALKTGTNVLSGASGYIYDNGGPNANTQNGAQYYYSPNFPNVRIEGCFDSIYLVFKKFEMYPGYEYVRIYEGKDRNGKKLTPTCALPSTAYGGGLTGSASMSSQTYVSPNCSPIRPGSTGGTFVYDTFKASKAMFIEMESNIYGNYMGFEAYYWTKPRSQNKPKAGFSSVDSICTNGQVLFTNTSTGDDVTYLWDLDDDMSAFEATTKNTNWPYFAPGQYKITLVVSNCGGPDTFSKTINVFNPAFPTTSFTADNVTPTTNDVVFFSKDMPMCVDDYRWTITPSSGSGKATYVNGTKNTSTNPQVMFSDTGCYDVSLYTKNTTGEDSLKLTCFIKVRGSYCVPTTQNKAADLGISNVKFHTIDNTSDQGLTPYSNFTTDPSKSTTIEIGVTYDLTVSRNTNKNKISRTAWIDWNADGDFDDAGEKVGEQTNSSTLSWTTQVKVPTLAKTGATLMRIAVNQGTQTNTPCGPNVFGEYEDYRIYVRPDATKPVIKMLGDDTVMVEQGYTYADAGATASDNLDGNLTSKIKMTSVPTFNNMVPATYIIKYNVVDAAGNVAEEVRRVVIVTPDATAPDLVVPEPETIYVEVFDANFTAPDAVLAEDLVDGDLLSEVQKTGNVNVNVVGTYEVVYTVTDASGNTATVKRIVVVEDKTAPVMALVGNATVTHEVGTPYTDDDVTISDNYYAEADLRAALVVQSNVDVNMLGTYTVVYTLTDPSGNGPVTVTRTVIVVDTQAPTLTMNGEETYTMEVNNTFPEPGITIADNYDNLTTWDTSGTFYSTFADGFADQLGTYTIIYTVTDGSGNQATLTRTVEVKDMTAPTATLLGEPGTMVCRWATYDDPGVEVSDNFDAKSDLIITEEGSFTLNRTMVIGVYYLRYKIEDKSGNVTYTDWRRVEVIEAGTGACITGVVEEGDMSKYVNVFPNPNSGAFRVNISLPKAEQVKITVTNLVGQQIAVVAEGMMSSDVIAVDLTDQASGVYMLNIQTATQNIVKRVVINK